MPIKMRVHAVESGKVPAIQRISSANGQTFTDGAILVYSSGQVVEGGTNPDDLVGIALQPADTNPGFAMANNPATITGRTQAVSLARFNDFTVFMATLTNNSSATVAPTQADVGAQYGLTAYSGIWTVDKNKTGANARVEVTGFDTTVYGGVVFFKVMESHISNQ